MRLSAKTLVVVTVVMAMSLAAALATRQWLVIPHLREIEAGADRKDLRRVLLAIDAKQQQLVALAYYNAVWDPMYEHLQQPQANRDFLERALPTDSFNAVSVDVLALFDRAGQLVEQRVVERAGQPAGALNPADFQANLIDPAQVRPRAPVFDSGLLRTTQGPLLYAVVSVMRSDTLSTAAGNLLLGQYFDDDLVRDIEEAAQLPVALMPLPIDYRDEALPASIDQLYRDRQDRLHWLLRDHAGTPLLRLTVQLPSRSADRRLVSVPLLAAFVTSIIGFAIILVLVQRGLIGPIQTIGRHLYDVRRHGDYSLRLNEERGDELGDLGRDIDALLDHVHSQQLQLQQQAQELQTLSYQDGLTGLANRRRFDQSLADNWALAQRGQTPLALIMCDVDYFKPFNDNYGHQLGDEVLKEVAKLIRDNVVRLSDIAARFGGEEFAILLPDTGESGALLIAERLQQELRVLAIPHEYSPISRSLTMSFGIASLVPSSAQGPRDLVRRADEALYVSKAEGRNRITLASALGYE